MKITKWILPEEKSTEKFWTKNLLCLLFGTQSYKNTGKVRIFPKQGGGGGALFPYNIKSLDLSRFAQICQIFENLVWIFWKHLMNLLHSWEDNVPTIPAIFQIWSSVDCWCMIVAVCKVAHFRSKMDWPSQCTKCPIPPISPSWESDLCTPTLIFFRRSYFSQNSAEPHHFPSFAEYASPKHHFITVYSHCAPFRTIFTYSRIIVTIRQLLFQFGGDTIS